MILTAIRDIEPGLMALISIIVYLSGLFLFATGLVRLLRHSDDRTSPSAPPMFGTFMCLLVGVVFVSFPAWLQGASESLFGSESAAHPVFSYGGGQQSVDIDLMINAAVRIINIAGLLAFLKGWIVLRNAADGRSGATYPAGAWHIVGGLLGWQILLVINAIQKTLNIQLISLGL